MKTIVNHIIQKLKYYNQFHPYKRIRTTQSPRDKFENPP